MDSDKRRRPNTPGIVTRAETGQARLVMWLVLAASLSMLIWMARSLFTGEVPFTGDLLHFHYPLRDFYARALHNGQRFDWMPSLFGGFYVVGEGQLGGYHPLHLLWYRLLPLDVAFGIELVAAYPFAFAGMWLFLRRRCDRASAAFGAMLFAFSGFNLSHGVHINMVTIIAHVPWLMWAIDRCWLATERHARARWAAVIGLLLGSQILVGHPQSVWFSLLIGGAYVAFLSMTRGIPSGTLAAVVGGVALGTMIGSVQLLATFHALRHSTRPADDVAYATSYALPPMHLLQLFNPYILWGRVLRWNEVAPAPDEYGAYGGGVVLVLASWAIALSLLGARSAPSQGPQRADVARWGGSKYCQPVQGEAPPSSGHQGRTLDWFVRWAAALGLVGGWLAIGARGGLYYLQTWMPIVSQFRVPARYILFTHVALALAAAFGFGRLLTGGATQEPGAARALWAPWSVALAAVIATIWLAAPQSSVASVLVVPAVMLLAAAFLTLAVRGARWPAVAIVVLAAGDLALYGLGGVIAWHDFLDRQEALGYLDTDDVPPGPDRLMHGGFPNLYTLGGYRVLDGYVAIAPNKMLDYRSPEALRLAQVRYVHTEFQKVAQVPGVEPLSHGWYRLPPSVPRARLVTRARVTHQPAIDLKSLNVDEAALTAHELALTGGPAGLARIVQDDPGSIHVRTSTESQQLLVVSESYDQGWGVTIDGEPTPLQQVNGDFIGCVVPAGVHRVAFEFRPGHLKVGRVVSASGWALALVLALVLGSRRGRRTSQER